ncbi:MAG: TetR/AcrR family transcriptional regulator [Halieaceae bacterium]|nr:TetR/AcrR family transcriptional regulator [Halieaceae bacterium]
MTSEAVVTRTRKVSESPTRATILDVSTRLFAREGYDKVAMRDISAKVGVTMPTIYHHFKDKKCLYREVERQSYGLLKQRLMDSITGKTDPRRRLRAFVGEFYDALNDDPIFLSLALRNLLDPGERHHQFLVSIAMQDVYQALVDLLNELQPGQGDGLAPIAMLSGVLGFIAMNPAKRQLGNYPLQSSSNRKERANFIDYVINAALATA